MGLVLLQARSRAMKIIKLVVPFLVGVLASGAEALAIVLTGCLLTGYWPSNVALQAYFWVACLLVFLYHRYVKGDAAF